MTRSSLHRAEILFYVLLLLYISCKGLYFALWGFPGIGPDELFHIQVINIHAHTHYLFPFLGSSSPFAMPLPSFSKFGNITEYPLLYHFLMGKIISLFNLNGYDFSTIVSLRILNLAFSVVNCGALLYGSTLLLSYAAERVLFAALCTSMLTYSLLAGTVGYDPLNNLLTTIMLIYCVHFFRSLNWNALCWAIIFGALGLCVKWTSLPIVFFASIALCLSTLHALRNKKLNRKVNKVLLISASLMVGSAAIFILSKYIKYGHLIPDCVQIYGTEACRQFESVAIPLNAPLLPWWQYIFVWVYYMLRSSYGIRSYIDIVPTHEFLVGLEIVYLSSLTMALRTLMRSELPYRLTLLIACGYCCITFWFCGYVPYHQVHHPELGVNGRYLFPILLPLGAAITRSLLAPFSGKRKIVFALLASSILLFEEFPAFLLSGAGKSFLSPKEPEWYSTEPYAPNPVYDQNMQLLLHP